MADTLASKLLSAPTERDKQRKIGPSTAGSVCDLCVVEGLQNTFKDTPHARQRYWAGAAIGTAVHERLETRAPLFFPEMLPEQKVTIGHLENYGWVGGTTDGVLPPTDNPFYPIKKWTALDWKTTTKEKLTWIRQAFLYEPTENENKMLASARFKVESYVGQTHLYAKGLVEAGVPIEEILISFICRDAVTENDFFEVTIEFDLDYANEIWARLERLWREVQDTETDYGWKGDPRCFTHGDRRY